MTNDPTTKRQPTADTSPRRFALIAGISLLLIALLTPFAQFGVLQTLVVPTSAAATTNNIIASEGLFRNGIAAFLIVAILDAVVAWALYRLLRPINRNLALVAGWLRFAYAVVFAIALVNLLDVAQLLGSTERSTLPPDQLQAQVMSSISSFDLGWVGIALGIFGLHLLILGFLLFKSAQSPKILSVLVMVAGGGYLADSFTRIVLPDFAFTFSLFTFFGEALLILWFFRIAIKGTQPSKSPQTLDGAALLGAEKVTTTS